MERLPSLYSLPTYGALLMSSDSSSKYTFQLLPDEPVGTDAFDGPHKRVANLIADMIDQGEFNGKMVALEGGWGSGKSSVVKMVAKRLDEIEQRSEDRQYRCVTFDAWSHQGDPLRRGFVEALDQELKANGDEADWLRDHRKKGKDDQSDSVEKEIGKLAKRVTESDDTTQRTPTLLALIFAFSVVMVPIGTAVMSVAADRLGPFKWWGPVHWIFIFGTLLLTSAPVIVAVTNALRLWIKRKGVFNPVNWPILNDTSEVKSKSTTITTADPTSIEFEETFAKIMEWALKEEKKRRLVIIIDNLDRVEPKRALAMWATLQTFFECKSRRDESEWWDRLCFIAPFDSEAIQKLLSHASPDQGHERENSFIDKSFATRFRVPPIVLTEWQVYFEKQLLQACRGIDTNEVKDVIRVCDGFRVVENGFHPTPRNIKKVINQAVNLLRQWGDESRYTPAVATCFVLLSRTHNEESLTKKLENNGVLNAVKRIIGEDGTRALAGLLYNTTPEQGEVIMLQRPISDALSSGNDKAMKKLLQDHGNGFWAVFEQNINEDRSTFTWEFFDGCIRVAHALEWNLETHPSIERFYEIIASKLESERDTRIPSQENAERLVMLKDIGMPDARRLAFDFWGRTTKRNEKTKTSPPTLECIRTLVDGLTDEAPGKNDGLLSLNLSDDEWLHWLGVLGLGMDSSGFAQKRVRHAYRFLQRFKSTPRDKASVSKTILQYGH